MRQKLNENPVAQIALIGVLALFAVIFLLKPFGGGEAGESESSGAVETPAAATPSEEAESALGAAASASSAAGVSAPAGRPLPNDVEAAYENGKVVVLLIYRPSGIDDRRLAAASQVVTGISNTALFTVPVDKIARYAAITGPLGVNQAPALIVIRPRSLNGGSPAAATVDYGFRSAADVRQAVVDASYSGPHLSYAPD